MESLFGRVLSPFESFLEQTTAGGIVLIGATIIALALAAWLGGDSIHQFWDQPVTVLPIKLSRHQWVNDGLMALLILNRTGVRKPLPYALAGAILWYGYVEFRCACHPRLSSTRD